MGSHCGPQQTWILSTSSSSWSERGMKSHILQDRLSSEPCTAAWETGAGAMSILHWGGLARIAPWGAAGTIHPRWGPADWAAVKPVPRKSNSQAHSPYCHGCPNCLLQALGKSEAGARATKPQQSRELWLVTGWCDWSWEFWNCKGDSSGGILTHSLLPSLYHLKGRGGRMDEPVATRYFTHIFTMSSSWNQRTLTAENISMGGVWDHFSIAFRITQYLCRIVWKIMYPRHIFESPWVEW